MEFATHDSLSGLAVPPTPRNYEFTFPLLSPLALFPHYSGPRSRLIQQGLNDADAPGEVDSYVPLPSAHVSPGLSHDSNPPNLAPRV